ncbi:hypothetical protein ACP4OV_013911 [Aristida adscensionis]
MRTAVLDWGWRDLWRSRWADSTSCLDVRLAGGDAPTPVLTALQGGPRHRLDRFSVVAVDSATFNRRHLWRFLKFAAAMPSSVSFMLTDGRASILWARRSNLEGLRELQLLMLGMETDNLACCPRLERLFVQLPDRPLEVRPQEVWVEPPPGAVLGNLRTVKIMNFNWRLIELQLVIFLLR